MSLAARQSDAGRMRHLCGRVAEDSVAARYVGAGGRILSRRWRGAAGEIDLVLEHEGTVVFVEVKRGGTWARAAERISARQMGRIRRSAANYLGYMPDGQLTEARIDVALVDGTGRIEIIPNAF